MVTSAELQAEVERLESQQAALTAGHRERHEPALPPGKRSAAQLLFAERIEGGRGTSKEARNVAERDATLAQRIHDDGASPAASRAPASRPEHREELASTIDREGLPR